MVTVVSMAIGFYTSVFMVTIQFGLCVMHYHGLHGLCGNVRALLMGDLVDRFVWFLWLPCLGGTPREYGGILSCDGYAAS
jgi:hypothetical protein